MTWCEEVWTSYIAIISASACLHWRRVGGQWVSHAVKVGGLEEREYKGSGQVLEYWASDWSRAAWETGPSLSRRIMRLLFRKPCIFMARSLKILQELVEMPCTRVIKANPNTHQLWGGTHSAEYIKKTNTLVKYQAKASPALHGTYIHRAWSGIGTRPWLRNYPRTEPTNHSTQRGIGTHPRWRNYPRTQPTNHSSGQRIGLLQAASREPFQ